jgi:hypothetical protein
MEQIIIDTRQFRFSAIADTTFKDQVFRVITLEELLNEKINLLSFSDIVERLYFVPIIKEDTEDQLVLLEYKPEQREVLLQGIISKPSDFSPKMELLHQMKLLNKQEGLPIFSEELLEAVKELVE